MIQVSTIRLEAPLTRACRIALLSDTHSAFARQLWKILPRERPDLLVIAGDLVHNRLDFDYKPRIWKFLELCTSVAPTFLALGNHEYGITRASLDTLQRCGVTVLDNAWIPTGELLLGGLTSGLVYPRQPAVEKPNLKWLKRFSEEPGYKVLLCHHPEYFPRYIRDLPVDLTLSGHAHGGQFRFRGQGLYAPGQGFLPELTSGLYENRLIVSRGVSNPVWPIPRLGNPPEVVLVELIPEKHREA